MYLNIAVSDSLIAFIQWTVIKKIAKEEADGIAKLGYIMGGVTGSLLSVFMSKSLGV